MILDVPSSYPGDQSVRTCLPYTDRAKESCVTGIHFDRPPTMADREYVRSLMHPVFEPGKIANWIAPPAAGIKGKPFEFEYVKL